MELYLSKTSPYARTVAVVLAEKGADRRVKRHYLDPWKTPEALTAHNPFSRIPVLIADDGTALTETLVISLYLEGVLPEPVLVPSATRTAVLRKAGLGYALIDAAVGIFLPQRLGLAAEQAPLRGRRLESMRRALPVIAGEAGTDGTHPDLGDLVIGVALSYTAFRVPELVWQDQQPALAQWHRALEARPSFAESRPD